MLFIEAAFPLLEKDRQVRSAFLESKVHIEVERASVCLLSHVNTRSRGGVSDGFLKVPPGDDHNQCHSHKVAACPSEGQIASQIGLLFKFP